MEDGTTGVSSTPTPAPLNPTSVLASMSDTELSDYRANGVPLKESPAAPADSAPAEPVEQVASTDASPTAASEPAKANGAKLRARTAALDAENRELQEQLRIRKALREELGRLEPPKADAKPAGSSPAPVQTDKFPKFADWLQTNPDGDLEDWIDARDEHRDSVREKTSREQFQRQQHARSFHEEVQTYSTRMKTAIADAQKTGMTEEQFFESISPELLALKLPEIAAAEAAAQGRPFRPTVDHDLAYVIRKSEEPAGMLRHLTDHPEDLATLRGARNREQLVWLFGRIEAQLSKPTASVTPPKTVTSAPAPPPTLGSRPAQSGDEVETALKRKDAGGYIAAMNARELAALKR